MLQPQVRLMKIIPSCCSGDHLGQQKVRGTGTPHPTLLRRKYKLVEMLPRIELVENRLVVLLLQGPHTAQDRSVYVQVASLYWIAP